MTRAIAILLCVALAGCSSVRSQETKTVEPGGEVTLAPGETVSVKAADMKVRFLGVTEDSRCPRDVNCIWAGQVKVRLEIRSRHAASQPEIAEGGSVVESGYRVTLVRVEPRPVSTARIAPAEYRATLKLDREN